MRTTAPDFSDASELQSWASKKIDELAISEQRFVSENVKFSHINSMPGHVAVYAACDTDAKPVFAADVKAIIQALRSSLDYVAVALAKANGATTLTDTYFPVTKSAALFDEAGAQKKIRRLDSGDRDIIRSLRPYAGGDDLIYALHTLNVENKHQRLGVFSMGGYPTGVLPGPSGNLDVKRFSLFKLEGLSATPKLVAQLQAKGQVKLTFATYLGFNLFPVPMDDPFVRPVLSAFSARVKGVIESFQ